MSDQSVPGAQGPEATIGGGHSTPAFSVPGPSSPSRAHAVPDPNAPTAPSVASGGGGGPPGPPNLPPSLAGLTTALTSLTGTLESNVSAQQELKNTLANMTGKQEQTDRSTSGTGRVGRSHLPTITVRTPIPHSGGQFSERETQDVRGQEGSSLGPSPGNVQSVYGMRQHAQRVISESTMFGPKLAEQQDPNNPNQTIRLQRSKASGKFEKFEGNDAAWASAQTKERVGTAIQGVVGRAAAGDGLSSISSLAGALPAGALAPLGIAAGVGATAYEGVKMAESQRAANAQYQSVLGGSNFSQFGQRAQEAEFGLSNLGTMSSGQSSQLFMGATQMGMRGGERDSMTSGAVDQYKSLGMSIQQSLQAANVEAGTGAENFDKLTQSLKGVSAAAVATGVNANTARQNLIQTMAGVTGNVGGGVGTQSAATAIATGQTNLGRNFQGDNFSGLTSPQEQQRMASQNGMSLGQFAGKSLLDPTFLAKATSKNLNSLIDDTPQGQTAKNSVSQILKQGGYQVGSNGQLSPEQQQNVGNQVLASGAMNPEAMRSTLIAAGLPAQSWSYGKIAQAFVGQVSGSLDPGAAATANDQKTQQQLGAHTINAAQTAALHGSSTGTNSLNHSEGNAASGVDYKTGKKMAGSQKIDVGSLNSGYFRFGGGDNQRVKTRKAYLKDVVGQGNKKGQGTDYGVLDTMMKDNSSWNQNYKVQTADGEKTVSFNDLVQHYGDQAVTGQVSFADGPQQGQTLASKYGMTGQHVNTQAQLNAASAKQKAEKKPGKLANPNKGKTNIVVSATPQLQQLLGFSVNGQNVSSNAATSLQPTLGAVNPNASPGVQSQYPNPGGG